MNIYLITEDGDSFCIKSASMENAVSICEKIYLQDMADTGADNLDQEKEYYHAQILQSCALVAELRNWEVVE